MTIRWSRVVVLLALLLAGVGVILWRHALHIPEVTATRVPWIGLPASGMDASEQGVRAALFKMQEVAERREERGFGFKSLEIDCGRADGYREGKPEIYVAWISRGFAGISGSWRIEFNVRGDDIEVTIEDARGVLTPAPAPPEPGTPPASAPPWRVDPPRTKRMTRAALQPIASAWRSSGTWRVPQPEIPSCTDGAPIFFEACISGRYAVRAPSCGNWTDKQTDHLIRLLEAITATE